MDKRSYQHFLSKINFNFNARDMYLNLKPPYSNDIDLRWDLPRDPPPFWQPRILHPPPPPRNLRWLASPGCTGKVNKLDI